MLNYYLNCKIGINYAKYSLFGFDFNHYETWQLSLNIKQI